MTICYTVKQWAHARIVPSEGWVVEWADFRYSVRADTLWLEAMQQADADEDIRAFLALRVHHGLPLADAARALGMTPRAMSGYVAPVLFRTILLWPARAGKLSINNNLRASVEKSNSFRRNS